MFRTTMLPNERVEQLSEQFHNISSRPVIRYTFITSSETNFIQYFSKDFTDDFQLIIPDNYEFVQPASEQTDVDLAILVTHGGDLSQPIRNVRKMLPEKAIIALWLWDNHISHLNNYNNALASDIVFPSHKYESAYLKNPVSLLGIHVPACSAQWTINEATEVFQDNLSRPRNDKLLVNYVDYPFSWRSSLLQKIKEYVDEADVLLMQQGDRGRYFGKSKADQMKEWLQYKSTIILPIHKDVSTRVFDALLTGQIILVPDFITDFDEVIKPDKQIELGVIRLHDLEINTIKSAIAKAVKVFDSQGESGIVARHKFALDSHLLPHRIYAILDHIKQLSCNASSITLDIDGHLSVH